MMTPVRIVHQINVPPSPSGSLRERADSRPLTPAQVRSLLGYLAERTRDVEEHVAEKRGHRFIRSGHAGCCCPCSIRY